MNNTVHTSSRLVITARVTPPLPTSHAAPAALTRPPGRRHQPRRGIMLANTLSSRPRERNFKSYSKVLHYHPFAYSGARQHVASRFTWRILLHTGLSNASTSCCVLGKEGRNVSLSAAGGGHHARTSGTTFTLFFRTIFFFAIRCTYTHLWPRPSSQRLAAKEVTSRHFIPSFCHIYIFFFPFCCQCQRE